MIPAPIIPIASVCMSRLLRLPRIIPPPDMPDKPPACRRLLSYFSVLHFLFWFCRQKKRRREKYGSMISQIVEHPPIVERTPAAQVSLRYGDVEARRFEHVDRRLRGSRMKVVVERVGPQNHPVDCGLRIADCGLRRSPRLFISLTPFFPVSLTPCLAAPEPFFERVWRKIRDLAFGVNSGDEFGDPVEQRRVSQEIDHARNARAAAAGQNRRPVTPAGRDGPDHVLFISRDHDADRNLPVVRRVGRVERAVARAEPDLAANGRMKLALQRRGVDLYC